MSERLGRYLLLRPLAAGGMGEVFLAEHTGISGFAKRVALKRIRPDLAKNPTYLQLFLNEARLGSFLNHPGIVHIFDVGHDGDDLWLVMEYVDGVDLKRLARRARLAGQPLSPTTLAAVMVEVLSALEEAHLGPTGDGPIIHRDMSPENILIARSGAVKVLDFGLAKYLPDTSEVPSLEGNMIFGKVRYMPPEQLRGHLIDARADLFSLGVVMYQLLTGRLPFGRGDANQVLAKILAGPPPPASDDAALDAIIQRALRPQREARFQRAEDMRKALVDYLRARAPELPFEQLREKLKLKQGDPGPLALEPDAPTEMALSVAERCGKCGGSFTTHFLEGMIVDRCTSCDGTWLDRYELERLIGQTSEAPTLSPRGRFQQAPLDRILGSCPVDRVGLEGFRVPNQPASIEVCPVCLGAWFDRGELQLLADPEVAHWMRELLNQHPEPSEHAKPTSLRPHAK